jgi:hypothetical protein
MDGEGEERAEGEGAHTKAHTKSSLGRAEGTGRSRDLIWKTVAVITKKRNNPQKERIR